MSNPAIRRLMTPDEMQAVEAMHGVTYSVGSWDKRFMRSVSSGEMITEKESAQLWRLFIKYRRQTSYPDKLRMLDFAAKHAAQDLRKQARQSDLSAEERAKYEAAMANKPTNA